MSISDLRKFPYVTELKQLRCQHCSSKEMIDHRDDGFGSGRGQFRAKCQGCGQYTWFDAPDKVADEIGNGRS